MSKMACLCGHVISDVVVPCPTEGWILRQQDQESYYRDACRHIVAFFRAIAAGEQRQWIAGFFGPEYPAELTDEDIVDDILTCRTPDVLLCVAECETCGRLWVQRAPLENSYRSYMPDEAGYAAVLRSCSATDS